MLALVAGTGRLPELLISHLLAEQRDVVLCKLEGFDIAGTGDLPVVSFQEKRRPRGLLCRCGAATPNRSVLD